MKEKKYNENTATILNGILAVELVLVILQLWLLMATMNAYLANDFTIVWPAAGASLLCFLLILGLLLNQK
jgi:hypothetical protein